MESYLTHSYSFPPIHIIHNLVYGLLPGSFRHNPGAGSTSVQEGPKSLYNLPIKLTSSLDEVEREKGKARINMGS